MLQKEISLQTYEQTLSRLRIHPNIIWTKFILQELLRTIRLVSVFKNAETWRLFIIERSSSHDSEAIKLIQFHVELRCFPSTDKCELINFAFCAQRPAHEIIYCVPSSVFKLKEKKEANRKKVLFACAFLTRIAQ